MYERLYGFSERPFQLTPDARFFYPSQGHRKALAFLRYGVQQGEGFVVITGDVGTGKTTLAQALLDELKGQRVAAANLVTTQLEDEELIRLVAASFGLPYAGLDKASLLKSLEGFFRDCIRQRKRVLLVVDEAQNLPSRSIEELRMLSNFQYQGKPLVQTFLLGQEQLRARISSLEFEQLRQRITAVHHLGPLNVNETKEYIEHRLHQVGWKNDPVLANSAFLAIHEETGGVPRRINTLCDRLFLYGFLEELHRFDDTSVQVVAAELREEYGDIGARTDVDHSAPFRSEGPVLPGVQRDEATAGAAPAAGPAAPPHAAPPHALVANGEATAALRSLEAAVRELTDGIRSEGAALRELLARLLPSDAARPAAAQRDGCADYTPRVD